MADEKTWFLIQTDKEFCIVLDTAVLFNEELNVGDRVFFFYTRNLRLEGTVRFISIDSDECQSEAKRLRKQQKKKEASFHADQPRKEKQRVKNLWLKSKDKKSSQLPSSSTPKSNSNSSILKSSNSSASGSNSLRVPIRTSSHTTEPVESPSKSKKKNPYKVREKENELPKRILVPVQNIRRTNGFNIEKMFVHSCESDLATEVHESTGIYCSLNHYALADGSNTATAVARRLMDGVFTFEALSTCSVTGLPPRGKGKLAYQDPSSIKPYLCPKGVNAIVCRAIKLQKLKHFSKKKDASQIRAAMAIRLNEIQKKLREAASAV